MLGSWRSCCEVAFMYFQFHCNVSWLFVCLHFICLTFAIEDLILESNGYQDVLALFLYRRQIRQCFLLPIISGICHGILYIWRSELSVMSGRKRFCYPLLNIWESQDAQFSAYIYRFRRIHSAKKKKNSSMLCSGEPSLLIRGASKSFTHIYSVIIFFCSDMWLALDCRENDQYDSPQRHLDWCVRVLTVVLGVSEESGWFQSSTLGYWVNSVNKVWSQSCRTQRGHCSSKKWEKERSEVQRYRRECNPRS